MWTKGCGFCLLLGMLLSTVAGAASFNQGELEEIYKNYSPALCVLKFAQEVMDARTGEMQQQNGNAVGLIVSPDGLLISNGHLQREGVRSYNFRMALQQESGEVEYKIALLEKPRDINLSFLRIKSDTPLDLPYIRFARNSMLSLGEEVAILGIMGETMDFHRSLTVSRVSAILDKPRLTYCLENALRLGYVSGPVINTRGEVTGITGFDLSTAEGGDIYTRSGNPLVFQADLFMQYVDAPPGESVETTDAEEAWLGVFTQPLKEEYAEYWGLEKSGGLIVSTVSPDSPAATAGFVPGDIIRVFDGQPVDASLDRDVLDFTKLVREKKPNAVIEVEVLRDGAPKVLLVTLGLRPRSARDADEYTDDTFGLVVREITRDIRILLNLGEEVQGVIVRRVVSGSPAHVARMQAGVIIMSLDNMPVNNLDDFEKGMNVIREKKAPEVSVFARVGATTGFFRVKPRW